ncbi:derlin-1 [Chelonus insularis]|uniref:derlin-1 n=1 Tax=Chelonus insularis TaxID=460826 RepID=UPI00158D0DDB|nr:derlin-1 [Chelonus insularis]
MSDLQVWLYSIPLFTRCWLLATVALSLVGRFSLISPQIFILIYDNFIYNFEVWRAVTSVFYYPIHQGTGFHFLMNCYFLYRYSFKLESEEYSGRPADYLFMLIFNWICCLIIGLIVNLPLLMDPMVLSILYIWCQLNQDIIINFWFGMQFKAMYLPWVLCGFNLIISGGGILELIGILVGNLYFFLKFKYPQEYDGYELLNTPKILESFFPSQRINIRGFSHNVQRSNGSERRIFRSHNWGQGHVLGN